MSIIVVGDIILDDYRMVSVSRVSPEAPCLIGLAQDKYYRLGGAANVANNIKSYGSDVMLAGVCSHLVESLLVENKIEFSIDIGTNSVKTRFIDRKSGTQLFRYDSESIHPTESSVASNSKLYDKHNVCIVADYMKGVITPYTDVRGCGINIVNTKNPYVNDIMPTRVGAVNILIVNDLEFMALHDFKRYDYVVRTEGADGMSVFNTTCKRVSHIPAFNVKLSDVTGAGDTVAATIGACLDRHGFSEENLVKSCYAASYAAAKVVEKIGTATVGCSFEQLDVLFRSYNV